MRGALVALTVAALVTSASTALADPSLADRESARSLMDDGDAKREHGDAKGALRSYEAADALMHVPTTAIEVARTQTQLGLLLEARETLARLLRVAPKPGEPAAFTTARNAAAQLSTEIGARIPSITVTVTNPDPGQPVAVTIDGDTIPPAAAQAPRKVNPGAHLIIARSGALEQKEDVTVAERENRVVNMVLKAAPVVERPKPAAVVPVAEAPAVEPASPSPVPKILLFGGFGLAAVGVGVGAVTGLLSISKVNDVKKDCSGNLCPPNRQSDIDSARSLGTISTIAFIVGGVGAALGVTGILLSGNASKESVRTASLRLDVAPSWLGAHGTF